MPGLADISQAAVLAALGNINLTRGVLAINAASAATIKSTNAYTYAIGGVFKALSALSAQAFSTGHAAQAPKSVNGTAYGSTAYYLVVVNAAGTVSTVAGNIHYDSLVSTGGDNPAAVLPDAPAGTAVLGALKVVVDSTHTFTPGTTALDAAGVTVTYFDLACIPASVAP